MAKYKVGDRMIYGSTELIVVKGNCNSCFFSAPHGCMSMFAEGCASILGYNLIFIPVGKGV